MKALTLEVLDFDDIKVYVDELIAIKGVSYRRYRAIYSEFGARHPAWYEILIVIMDDELETMLRLKYGNMIKDRSA